MIRLRQVIRAFMTKIVATMGIIDEADEMTLEEQGLAREIEEVYKEMTRSLDHFNNVMEPELIEYYIYQYKAAQIKHSYLLKCMKELYYN